MQTIIYNKDTKRISKVIRNGTVKDKTVKGDDGSCKVGDTGLIIQVPDDTVKIEIVDEMEVFTPDKIDINWTTEPAPKTLEDRVKDLETSITEIKAKLLLK